MIKERIRKDVEKEFPSDPALQQVHIARKILAREAEQRGSSFVEYVRLQVKKIRRTKHGE